MNGQLRMSEAPLVESRLTGPSVRRSRARRGTRYGFHCIEIPTHSHDAVGTSSLNCCASWALREQHTLRPHEGSRRASSPSSARERVKWYVRHIAATVTEVTDCRRILTATDEGCRGGGPRSADWCSRTQQTALLKARGVTGRRVAKPAWTVQSAESPESAAFLICTNARRC